MSSYIKKVEKLYCRCDETLAIINDICNEWSKSYRFIVGMDDYIDNIFNYFYDGRNHSRQYLNNYRNLKLYVLMRKDAVDDIHRAELNMRIQFIVHDMNIYRYRLRHYIK